MVSVLPWYFIQFSYFELEIWFNLYLSPLTSNSAPQLSHFKMVLVPKPNAPLWILEFNDPVLQTGQSGLSLSSLSIDNFNPQSKQYLALTGLLYPHCGQIILLSSISNLAPHSSQNLAFTGFSVPQLEQVTI